MRSIFLSGLASIGMLLAAVPACAQEEIDLPDSLLFGAPVEVVHVATLADVGSAMAELPEVDARLIEREAAWYGSTYALAIASGTGHDLLPILGDGRVNEVQVSTADVRGNGHLQVVVRTMSYAGHTGWEHAIHEREWAVSVWDLQERRCLLYLMHGYSHEEWTNTLAPIVRESSRTRNVRCSLPKENSTADCMLPRSLPGSSRWSGRMPARAWRMRRGPRSARAIRSATCWSRADGRGSEAARHRQPPPSAWYMFTIAFICCMRVSTRSNLDSRASLWVSNTSM